MKNRGAMFVDYQQRAKEFAVGDSVVSTASTPQRVYGRVIAVYPAIGMVDVEWPNGNTREPVESLMRQSLETIAPPETENVPGGVSSRRVAEAYVKKALYWAAPDRHYRATREECLSGKFRCPKCKETTLKPASYQRAGGSSEKLLGCPGCLFLIKPCDIIGHPDYAEDDVQPPFSRVRMTGGV